MSLFTLSEPIPFKSENLTDTGGMWTALGVSVVLLILLAGVIVLSKRNKLGFLRPWLNGGAEQEKITLVATRRLSATSSVQIIAYAGMEYMVVESGRGGALSVQPLAVHKDPQA